MPGTISLGSYTIPFDEEIFAAYLQNEPDLVTDAMIQSGIMVEDPFIASLIQGGGNVYTIPFYSNLADSSDNNYDGKTDITLDTMGASHQTGVVYGRAHGWFADDFVADFTAANPMAAIAARVNKYWMNKKQARTIGMVDAVLSKSAMAANTVTKSTVGGTSLSDATQEIWGEHKRSVGLAIMHSAVAQTYEDLQRVEYLKYTDPNGVTRALQIFEINGIATIIDDGVPKSMTDATSAGVYTIAVGGTVASGDKITVNGVTVTLDSTSGADATAAATALKSALEADETFNATYGMTRSTSTLTVTESNIEMLPRDISKASVAPIADRTYNGSPIKPALTVTYEGKALVEGTDYTVSWRNNVSVGTATAVITGKGEYEGTLEASFKIVARSSSQQASGASAAKRSASTTKTSSTLPKTGDPAAALGLFALMGGALLAAGATIRRQR